MRHRKIQELIGAYADGELRAADKPRVEKHLKTCPECRRDLEFIRKIATMAESSPPAPPGGGYWDSFAGRVGPGSPASRPEPPHPESRRVRCSGFLLSAGKPDETEGGPVPAVAHRARRHHRPPHRASPSQDRESAHRRGL